MTPEPLDRAGEIRSLARVSRAADGTGASAPQPPRGALAETSAIPSPETRPAHLDRAASQVRGRVRASAESAPSESSALSAGQLAIAAAMSEDKGPDSLDAHIRRLMADLGLMGYHTKDSRRSAKGYPDWTIAGPGGVLFRELKTQRGKLTKEQWVWANALNLAGADWDVWRPEQLLDGTVAREMAVLAGLNAGTT